MKEPEKDNPGPGMWFCKFDLMIAAKLKQNSHFFGKYGYDVARAVLVFNFCDSERL